ncbi:MAG: hypothetical protein WDZ35_05070 [Crocinitomicaceae bacterium]
MLRKIFHFLLRQFRMLSFYSLSKSGYLVDKGWFRSFRSKNAIDQNGQPIPWMTYSFLDFLQPRIRDNMTIFEFGCGNSTLWWQSQVKSVYSCESDQEWYDHIKTKIGQHVQLMYRPTENSAFAESITECTRLFDIIVIDGADRVSCAKNALKNISTTGVVIWDNSDRSEYQQGYDLLTDHGFKRIDFHGLGPINVMSWSTSVFYRSNNCLSI